MSVHGCFDVRFSGVDFDKYTAYVPQIVDCLTDRSGKAGQFLNWIDLPKLQIRRLEHIYQIAMQLKQRTGATRLVVIGIGGSKHTIEHMLSVNGLNITGDDVLFYSDVDTISLQRLVWRIGDITTANYLVVSKSGNTFETMDAMFRIRKMLVDEYMARGARNPEQCAIQHFVAASDADSGRSALRRLSDAEDWIGDLYIHDDVGGRFSVFDDHVLFVLAFAGMPLDDMRAMLDGAIAASSVSLNCVLAENIALQMALFWLDATLSGIGDFVHLYMGDVFEKTVLWHTQMQNESIKNTRMQIAKIPDAMHHSAEAHFIKSSTYAYAITMPIDMGICSENTVAYENAIINSYSAFGATACEYVEMNDMGLTPRAAGVISQLRAFATVYQDVAGLVVGGMDLPDVLHCVVQPHVEEYKKNLKGGVVVAGRMSLVE